jgi:hypothetical protein
MKKLKNFEKYSEYDLTRGEEDKRTTFGIDIKGKGDFRKDALIKKKLVRLKNRIEDEHMKKEIEDILDLLN